MTGARDTPPGPQPAGTVPPGFPLPYAAPPRPRRHWLVRAGRTLLGVLVGYYLLAVVLLAGAVPAHRAARIDPLSAMRTE